MPQVSVERRGAPRHALVLAAEVVELPRGAKFCTRTADISRGCYIDTLNPIPTGSQICLRITHHQEIFEALGRVVYVSPGLGMGVAFAVVSSEERSRLDRWLAETGAEF
jgi:hypothetical protein